MRKMMTCHITAIAQYSSVHLQKIKWCHIFCRYMPGLCWCNFPCAEILTAKRYVYLSLCMVFVEICHRVMNLGDVMNSYPHSNIGTRNGKGTAGGLYGKQSIYRIYGLYVLVVNDSKCSCSSHLKCVATNGIDVADVVTVARTTPKVATRNLAYL